MKVFILISALSLAFVVQSKISIIGIPPAFTVIAPYYIGLTRGWKKGILGGSVVGIIEDSLSGNILGPHLLGKGIVGFLSSFLSGSLFRWTPLLGLLGLFSLTILDGFSVFVTKAIFNIQFIPASRLISTLLFQGLLNCIAGTVLRSKDAE